jgi:hypothetical protein
LRNTRTVFNIHCFLRLGHFLVSFRHAIYKMFRLEIDMPKNGSKRRAWTSEQVRELKTMARKKTPASHIAKKLKRTEGATRQKAFSMGLSLDSR